MLAMALLLHAGLLGGVGGEAAGVDGPGEGAWTLATPAEGPLASRSQSDPHTRKASSSVFKLEYP
jgi:hypothetical protein